ncbi:unnamed protein product [Schistocephalus solidus]|uniref:PH domain-containing protein n=1 Tax=Schistocephalus solidus TaxID=70667 RepID=A0A183T1R6_SCHSO|nr:unnamed protein product [Schistocephalus solidus]
MSVLPSPSKNSALLGDISSTEYKREAASDLAVGQKSDNVEFGGGKTRSEYQPSSAANSPSSNNRRLRPRLAPGIPKSLQESSSTSHLTVSSSSTDARSPHGRKGTLTSAGSMPSLRVLPNQGGSSASRKVPEPLEGYILKGRKWPLKGYHKLSKGRYSARIDLANTFVTAEKAKLNIEIDASIVVYHLKFESQADFQHWLQAITEHRQFDQHQNAISAVKQGEARHPPPIEPIEKRTASPVGLSSYQLLNGQMEKAQAPLQSSASEQVSPVGKRVPVQLAPQSAMSSPQLREQMAQDNAMTSLLRAFHFLKKDYDHFCEVQDSLSKITTGRDVTGPSPTRTEFFSPMSTLNSPVPFVPEQSPDLLGHMRKASSLSSFHSAQTIVRKTSTGDSDLCGRLQTVLSDTNAAASALSESAKSFLEKAKSVMERLSQLPPDVNSHPNTVFRRSKPPIDRISADTHLAITDTLRQRDQTSYDVVPDGKCDTSVTSLCLWRAAPEEGVSGTYLLLLTKLR